MWVMAFVFSDFIYRSFRKKQLVGKHDGSTVVVSTAML